MNLKFEVLGILEGKLLKLKHILPWFFILAVLFVVVWIAAQLAANFAFDQTAQRGRTTLRLTIAGLKGVLGQYRSLPQLIADNRNIRDFLASSTSLSLTNRVNRELKRINGVVQASDTYLMNNDGLTIAASNFDSDTSFVGENFSYRPYFQDAKVGKLGKFFALGSTSLKRGYYFSSAIRVKGSIAGVIAVKVDIDEIESAWESRDQEILVTDKNGIIFMSSRKDWLFKSIKPLSETVLKALETTRKYGDTKISELLVKRASSANKSYSTITVEDDKGALEYLAQKENMPSQAWTVHVFSSTGPARAQAYTMTAAVLFVLLSMLLGSAIFILRRQRLHERINAQHKARQELEKQVEVRTFDLNQANTKLVGEISERKATEEELRKTQAGLVQAGKLAALGQMSIALSHEFNQPLGAAKSYADNAAVYLDRGRIEDARENVTRISSLVDRMASISKHLHNFARKPNEKTSRVPVATVVNDALEILGRRIEKSATDIVIDLPKKELWVVGGQIRLQQVLVNLISNGLDATENVNGAKIEIAAKLERGKVIISIRDNGPGIELDSEDQIFDPFFTTKGVGKGLGLGLSISYNIIKDFGGDLSAVNNEADGATFLISLRPASKIEREVKK